MSPSINRQWRLAQRPVGDVKPGDLVLQESPKPVPGKGQILVRNLYLSLDPTNRIWMSDMDQYMPPVEIGDVMRGGTLGVVEHSNADGFAPGDIVILPYCRYVVDPVQLEIREGHITRIDGGLDAKLMRDWLEDGRQNERDRDPFAVSHLGWGMNPQAPWYWMALHGDDPERNRAAARVFPGNFLFSTGPNTQGGGKRSTRGHYDVPMRDCTVELDGRTIIDRGRFTDPRLVVAREQR